MSNNNSDSRAFAKSDSLFQDLSPSEESMVTGGRLLVKDIFTREQRLAIPFGIRKAINRFLKDFPF